MATRQIPQMMVAPLSLPKRRRLLLQNVVDDLGESSADVSEECSELESVVEGRFVSSDSYSDIVLEPFGEVMVETNVPRQRVILGSAMVGDDVAKVVDTTKTLSDEVPLVSPLPLQTIYEMPFFMDKVHLSAMSSNAMIAHLTKGLSLFGVIPCFERIPMRGVVMTKSQVDREALLVDKTPTNMDDTTVKEEEDKIVIGANELAVVSCSSQPWSAVSSGIMMTVVSGHEVLTGVNTLAAVVTVASDGHLDDMSKFFVI
ncbi:hypothetical protein FCV25MIE_26488 [Fagus crenata]